MSALKESSDPSIKKCFKCGGEFPLTNFYKHPGMSDGRLNKCKGCTKKDVRTNYKENKEVPDKKNSLLSRLVNRRPNQGDTKFLLVS